MAIMHYVILRTATYNRSCFRVFLSDLLLFHTCKMSKLDVLHSHLLNRMSAVIREIFEELEATVKDYRDETLLTRAENAKLKRQLRNVFIRTETRVNGQVHHVSQNIPKDVIPTELQAGGSGSGSKKETEDQETQLTEDHDQSPYLFRDEKPCLQNFIKSEDRDPVHFKSSSPTVSCYPTEEQQLVSPSTNEWCNLPAVGTDRIKTEQEDTFITITSSVITSPAHAGQCQGSDTTHQLRTGCEASRKELHCTHHSSIPANVSARISDSHHRDGPYKCNKCGRQLKDLAKLHLHRKLHERSFSCHWCGRKFSKFDYLRMHMRTHTGERPYRCNWCSKTFTQCGNMRRHERTCQRFTEETTVNILKDRPSCLKSPLKKQ